jgi:hypothetical protein
VALPIERTQRVHDGRSHAERGNEKPQLLVSAAINAYSKLLT